MSSGVETSLAVLPVMIRDSSTSLGMTKFRRSKTAATDLDLQSRHPMGSSKMLDIRLVREKSDFVKERLATRGGGDEAKIDELLAVDAQERHELTELQKLNAERNRLSKEIGALRVQKKESEALE